eukprot:364976-Chlamydomonas_euryale.AAC.18
MRSEGGEGADDTFRRCEQEVRAGRRPQGQPLHLQERGMNRSAGGWGRAASPAGTGSLMRWVGPASPAGAGSLMGWWDLQEPAGTGSLMGWVGPASPAGTGSLTGWWDLQEPAA